MTTLPKSFIPDATLPKSFVPDVPVAPETPEPEKRPGMFSMATLKGETTYHAATGGAGDIAPNIVRTFGNIPSSAAKIVRGFAAPVNPLDLNNPINIGKNIVESAVATKDIFKNRGLVGGVKDIAGGFVDTAKKGYTAWKDIGESIYGNLERNVVYGGDKPSVIGGLGISAGQAVSNVAKIGIEDPLLLPFLMGGKNISRIASPVTRGADTSLDAIYTKYQTSRDLAQVTKREKEIFDIENQYVKTRKAMDYSKDANATSRHRVASTDVLVGSIDDTGKIRTNQPGGAVDKYKSMTIDGTESVVRDSLVKEGKTIEPAKLESMLKANIEKNAL